ncbi:hypothetical protein [Acinetobacter johnsonii]|uniref:hypothetical protein n=1 Tax=Acinetobacter johnsonii TaxID=40214 RepID=UPI0032B51087
MEIQEENNLIQEAFEVEADEVGFCLDQKWGDYENPYENSDTALAFNLFKKGWQAAAAQAVPEGFVLVEKELSWVKADHLACAEWEKNKALFCTENRDITALQIEEYRLRWCKNKAHKIMSEYKAMIEAQEQSHECQNP